MNLQIMKTHRGFSILEVTIGLFISSILVTVAYKTNNYFTQSTLRENQKALITQQIITINDFITKDIRMAGLGLPGNGIRATLNDTTNDHLQIFINEPGNRTTLTKTLQYSDFIVIVSSADGMRSDGWICIADTADTVYRKISLIRIDMSGADTVYLENALHTGPFTLASAVYPASRIEYFVNAGDNKGLHRTVNGNAINLAPFLDILSIIPKSAAGSVLGGEGRSAAVLSIVIGKELKSGNSTSAITDSTEVNIRNKG